MDKLTVGCTPQGDTLTFALTGRLDSITSPDFSEQLLDAFDRANEIVLDATGLVYVSSAGLRVILAAQKKAQSTQKQFALTGVSEEILHLFEMTGFTDILTIR